MQVHIPLLILCVVLCLFPSKNGTFREKWIMPICMLLITVYMAIRYDYGLDFWSYYRSFTSGDYRTEDTEPLFWLFMDIFPKYYQLIAAISIALMVTIFSWVKKFVNNQWYWLFFICFMCIPGMSWQMMSALRTVMAFVVLSFGIYQYYIKQTRVGLYIISVIAATLFHSSAMIFIILPFISNLVLKINPRVFFAAFLLFSVFSFTGISQHISEFVFNIVFQFGWIDPEHYSFYATKYISNANGAIFRSLWLFPAYYICNFERNINSPIYDKFYVLSIIYFSIFFLSLDLEFRFTLYLFIFVIIAITYCLTQMNTLNRIIAVLPMLVSCLYHLYSYYVLMREERYGIYSEGNFFIYQTIFDNLPLI